jgi:preprotein translocase subunit SecE
MAKPVAVAAASDEGFGGKVKAWPERAKSFYNDVRAEMKKVTTPSFKEVRATTGVVIVAVFIFGLYFFVIDNAIGKGIDSLLRYFAHR